MVERIKREREGDDALLSREDLQSLINRRDYLCKFSPKCHACSHEQVQLVRCDIVPSNWKCRMCKHRFLFEPAPTALDTAARVGDDAPRWCEGCGRDWADPPSKLCPVCQAYKGHQS